MTKILIVEDDTVMGALVQQGLEGEGYSVSLVTNGMDALIAATSNDFSAAAIDVMLPEMWGTTANIDANVVDQYVSYLRRKLNPHTAGVVISTVRGVGYSLAEVE